MLAASLIFYAWGEGLYILVLLWIILMNYGLGILIGKSKKHRKMWASYAVALNVAALVYFKYLVFFAQILTKPLVHLGLHTSPNLNIHMPLGISFITFHAMSYVLDIHRKKIKPEKNFLNLALYMSLFPHLIAGPIVRYFDIGKQIKKRTVNLKNFSYGINRFVIGLGKKVIIANTMAKLSDQIFALYPQQLSGQALWLGLLAYSFQIFFDFSGYSDMAIGLAKMFGFTFAENFNYPYISKSIREFWHRWHMTLYHWFLDYLYIPIGGSRRGRWRTVFNIIFVFLLTGFWHGAAWHFIFWGFYYGVFLSLEFLFLRKILEKIWTPLSHIYALLVIVVGWLFFRVENLSYAIFLFKMLFGLIRNKAPVFTLSFFINPQIVTIFLVAILASTPIAPFLLKKFKPHLSFAFLRIAFMSSVLFYSILLLASDTYNPFIYFRF